MKRDRLRIWGFHFLYLSLILIAVRHFWRPGDYLWTGEASRLTWSMRLKGKVCEYAVRVGSGDWTPLDIRALSPWQRGNLDDPYFFMRFVQATYCTHAARVQGRANCRAISRFPADLIQPDVNLCQASYDFFRHNEWITSEPGAWDPHYLRWYESSPRVRQE